MKAPAGRKKPRREKPVAEDSALRKHLVELLRGGNAHADFEQAVGGLPVKLRGARVPNLPFSPWKLLEHLRIAQRDILEFSRNPGHVSLNWPDGYWPAEDAPTNSAAWDASVAAFQHDLKELQALVKNPYLKVLVMEGYYDLATPYYAANYTIDHLDLGAKYRQNISIAAYESGHMAYLPIDSLKKMKTDEMNFMAKAWTGE